MTAIARHHSLSGTGDEHLRTHPGPVFPGKTVEIIVIAVVLDGIGSCLLRAFNR